MEMDHLNPRLVQPQSKMQHVLDKTEAQKRRVRG